MIDVFTRTHASRIVHGVHDRAVLASAEESVWYTYFVQAGVAVEIELSDMPYGVQYDFALYDQAGNCVQETAQHLDRVRFASFVATQDEEIYIRVFSHHGCDPDQEFALHVDRYQCLQGTLTGRHRLLANEGPYRLVGDVVITAGAVLEVEAGTILNVRSHNCLRVQAGGTLSLLGDAHRPIVILGATPSVGGGLWQRLLLEGITARVNHQFVTIHYDHAELLHPQAHRHLLNLLPSERPALIRDWYKAGSPYLARLLEGVERRGRWYEPWMFRKRDFYFGMDVEMFAEWEVRSGRLCDHRFVQGEVNYWEFVNAGFVQDLLLARRCVEQDHPAPHHRIQHLMEYWQQGRSWRAKHGVLKSTQVLFALEDALDAQSELHEHLQEMSRLFWKSHNTSIIYWDQSARALGLYDQETQEERLFINGVIIRLHFTCDLPYQFLSFGNQMPPVGMIGLFLNHGPFKYPAVYPAPPAPPAPQGTLDYHEETMVALFKMYLRFLLQKGTNPVYTWWLPTPADREVQDLLATTGLTWDASPLDWKREVIDPALQTLHEIQAQYLTSE